MVGLTETVSGAGNSWDDRDVEEYLGRISWEVNGDEVMCDSCVRDMESDALAEEERLEEEENNEEEED